MKEKFFYMILIFIINCDSLIGGLRTEVSKNSNEVYFFFDKETEVEYFYVADKNNRKKVWEFDCLKSTKVSKGTPKFKYGKPFEGCIVEKNLLKKLKKGNSYYASYSGPSVVYMGDVDFDY